MTIQKQGFTIREILGEDKYTEIMAKLHGYKVEKLTKEELKNIEDAKRGNRISPTQKTLGIMQ